MCHDVSQQHPPPAATIRAQVSVPLAFADGYQTIARVFTFDGLVDGLEHVALGLGDRAEPSAPGADHGSPPLVRVHSDCFKAEVCGRDR